MDAAASKKRDGFLKSLADGPQVMGIVNVTPDSFSDGGRFEAPDLAIAEALRHVAQGAAVVDVGAESTRPGHVPVSEAEEQARLAPIFSTLAEALDVAASIDTTKASVAAAALKAGFAVVNDQWGLQRDPAMADAVADGEGALAIMHNRQAVDPEADVIDDMCRFFERSLAIAARAGIAEERIILDPGIGFGKTKRQNITALGEGVAALGRFGRPVMVGVSRKSLFAALIGRTAVEERLIGTIAANLSAFARGARLFRVHDCAENRDALAVFHAIAHG